ncbi:hypothetical protein [Chondromyces crocatus]|nr:hypothetical protein [Chondromyces crocatus]
MASTPGALAYDALSALRSEALVEQSHRIALSVDRGQASLVVRRTVFNGGPRHDEATFLFDVPRGAVATALGSLGVKDGKPFWFRGDLMEAEAAAEKYRELTGVGGFYPKDPALLSWRDQSRLALQVFPCAPNQPKTIEYTLKLPTEYRDGRYHVVLPRLGTEKLAPSVVVTPARAGDRLFVDDKPVPPGAAFTLGQDDTHVSLAPAGMREITGALAAVPVDDAFTLVQFEFDTPPRLSEPPRNARVVVVLDGSRSLSDGMAAGEIAAARAYLSHLPDALVQVLTFDREVHARHRGFVPASTAIADLGRMDLRTRNGSRVDDALARADALLAATPPGLPRRIVVLTDLLTRSTLTPERVGPLLAKSGALAHVGILRGGAPELQRDDDHAWSRPIRATGGLVWHAYASEERSHAKAMTAVYEELARPTRLHHVDVRAPGLDLPLLVDYGLLPEGQGIAHIDVHPAKASATEVELRGELWTKPVSQVLRPDAKHGDRWSALVFGSAAAWRLDDEQMMPLALRGGAVSPVTSYLAIEPGVRPSTEGIEREARGGSVGFGSGRASGVGRVYGAKIHFDHLAYLRNELTAAFKQCPAGASTATVALETTRDEVVDVTSVQLAGHAAGQPQGATDTAIARCLEEATWNLTLPLRFDATFERYVVAVTR